ncbi:MAG: 2,3-bisphosphoglycerate-independent phosphoglycerate mutase [Zetaproteobacteria bacterium CG06_land_8_20_14_3_00_59_53]|nr:MAG: phosphoglycerate mutase (2,3-diphosphoglycerate-independent) [Zetaproteobacteria bacterium CG2_30_59_37]PIO89989.1 MAG: 2,3-bisphosphoglycerate-independent phosphoglycerate mutase [Zetaproteobacteria bacterium CG23_combo_of_CG06-09_8_20_14_all_59_86]PIQ64096.1 MAG: 2,3-bisphosphoglycerate-independent phosphoglycerate mutase [Zetaproteobacteria bacterium CG11_big_fil_rev_8_21_14_0_20_59_439]PIU69920.1 MAG: 2,3-bisphosphoglycerate-independent phosphoglycerate mutase [Zetaproteobacteria bac
MSVEQHFAGRSPALLIIMDGWGIGTGGAEDAIAKARTPVFDRLMREYPSTRLMTHGPFVGLPSGKDLGGSEVGHLTMGAGMILDQGPTRINKAIEDGSFYESDALCKVVQRGVEGGCIHLLGLLSDGNIHSHVDHFLALVDHAFASGVRRLRVHALLDGRDVGIQSAQTYVAMLEEVFVRINAKDGYDYSFASGGGRERIIMDRDNDWSKVGAGWKLMVEGAGEYRFTSMQAAIDSFRATTPDIVDQDIPGFVIVDESGRAVGTVNDGDAVVMVNFRGDRAIEMTEAFELDDFSGFDRGGVNGRGPDVLYAGMMVYDEDRNLPELQLMGPTKVANPLGRRLLSMGIRQFRLTETQKYPHVTFFFNGGYREPLDRSMEDYILIPSDKGVSFADAPQMKAAEIADKAIELIAAGGYGFGLINFANADMVGHCGHMKPVIEAIEAVDTAVGRIVDALQAAGGSALITADHGNAEEMRVANKHGDEPSTRHSLNPVPCILFDAAFDGSYTLRQPVEGDNVYTRPGLSHIAATMLNMLGQHAPDELQPSLLEPKGA